MITEIDCKQSVILHRLFFRSNNGKTFPYHEKLQIGIPHFSMAYILLLRY